MSQPNLVVREILDKISLVEVVSDYVQLKKAGNSWKGLCPFHNEKTPSFNVNESKGLYYCFGCQSGGNAITFLTQVAGLTPREAVERLAKRAGVELPERTEYSPQQSRAAKERADMLHAVHVANEYFQKALKASDHARSYLATRGVDSALASKYGLGYGGDGHGLLRELAARKVSFDIAQAVGLILPSQHGGYYERFRNRLVFPVFNLDGAAIAFSARQIPPDEDGPKFVNSPESPIYTKGAAVFGLLQARQAIRKSQKIIIVEGNFDVLSLAAKGVENVVAPLGTALTPEQIRLVRRFTENVVLWFDGDEAGQKATHRSISLLIEAGIEAEVIQTAAGEDPDSVARNALVDSLPTVLDNAIPMITYLVESMLKTHSNTPHSKRKVVEEFKEAISSEKDPFRYGRYREELARLLVIDVKEVQHILRSPDTIIEQSDVKKLTPVAERTLLELFLCEGTLIERFLQEDPLKELLVDSEVKELFEQMQAAYESGNHDLGAWLVNNGQEDDGSLRTRLYKSIMIEGIHPDPELEFDQIIGRLRRERMESQQKHLQERLRLAQREGRQEDTLELALEIARIKRLIISARTS